MTGKKSAIPNSYLVISGEQQVRALLSAMRHYRPDWIVLRDKAGYMFAFPCQELAKLLRGKDPDRPALSALDLQRTDRSFVVKPGNIPPARSVIAGKKPRYASAARFVRIGASGNVLGVHELPAEIKKTRRARVTYSHGVRGGGYHSSKGQLTRARKKRIDFSERGYGDGGVSRAGGVASAAQLERVRRAFLTSAKAKHLGLARETVVSLTPSGPTSSIPKTSGEYNLVRVFYATDRAIAKSQPDGSITYANERSADGNLRYGTCDVSIPFVPRHHPGRIETPSIWRLQLKARPEKHVVLLKAIQQDRRTFFDQMRQLVANSRQRSAFIFVHGYNVSFEDAAKRTAVLAFDLRFPGAPILYSWPSKASKRAYPKDSETIDLTKKQLASFLADVATNSGVKTLHVIAHSMGNRALVRALDGMATSEAKPRPRFRQIILTAPDVNREEFLPLAETVCSFGRRVTLYGSSKDIPLFFSRKLNEYDRVGYFGGDIPIIKNIDSIDASKVKTDFWGHTAIKGKTVLLDLFDLVWHGHPPDERPAIEAKNIPAGKYWEFR